MMTKTTAKTHNVDALAIPAQFDRTGKANGQANMADQLAALQAQMALLMTQNQSLQAKLAAKTTAKPITMKVSEKGALSLYGLGRFPVTLYRGQWERLLAQKETIEAYIQENASSLAVKE
jgi:hypothetical protein